MRAGVGDRAQGPRNDVDRGVRVLVVEDAPETLKLIVRVLRREGFQVDTAEDGPRAVQRALAVRPDVIVLDVGLPGLDGMEVCRQIRPSRTRTSSCSRPGPIRSTSSSACRSARTTT